MSHALAQQLAAGDPQRPCPRGSHSTFRSLPTSGTCSPKPPPRLGTEVDSCCRKGGCSPLGQLLFPVSPGTKATGSSEGPPSPLQLLTLQPLCISTRCPARGPTLSHPERGTPSSSHLSVMLGSAPRPAGPGKTRICMKSGREGLSPRLGLEALAPESFPLIRPLTGRGLDLAGTPPNDADSPKPSQTGLRRQGVEKPRHQALA